MPGNGGKCHFSRSQGDIFTNPKPKQLLPFFTWKIINQLSDKLTKILFFSTSELLYLSNKSNLSFIMQEKVVN